MRGKPEMFDSAIDPAYLADQGSLGAGGPEIAQKLAKTTRAAKKRPPGSLFCFMAERDFTAAVCSRVVVFDGGMGATLEQFDLSSEDYGGLPGKCHEALVLNRPDVIEGVHESMLEAGA